jgi:HEAT repeat protein
MVHRLLDRGLLCLSLVVTAATLPAHGGQYRGPWNAPPTPGVPTAPGAAGTPTTGGGLLGGPGAPGPTTGGRPSISDGTSWQVWWEFNKDPLLETLAVEASLPITGSDEFYLGSTRRRFARDTARATEVDRQDRIAAALAEALRTTNNRDLSTAAMIGLAKVGLDPTGVKMKDLFQKRLADGDQEVRESAALALGISGQETAVQPLVDLLADTAAGRKLAGGEVPDRTRTFAAWGLGLLARRSGKLAVKQRVHDELLAVLHDKNQKSRDLRVGAIEGLGTFGTEANGAEKRLVWQTAAELWAYYDLDLGKGDQLVQAHVPIAVARLLGRGTTSEHQKAKQRLMAELFNKQSRHNAIYQSAAMALGTMCAQPEQSEEDAVLCKDLLRYYKDGTDQLTRFFCLLSLGRIGGDQNRAALLSVFHSANRATERPWVALGLGLIARQRAQAEGGAIDEEVGRLLRDEFADNHTFDVQSALALSVGLTGYEPAADVLIPHLEDGDKNDQLVGYCAVALALLDHHPAANALVTLMKDSKRRPFVLQQCAIALGRLGDVRTVPLLQEMLEDSNSTAVLSSVAMALSEVGDRRSIDPLIATLKDRERTFLAKAFAAVALGGIGDKDPLPWNTVIATGMNYMATVDTLTNGSTGVLDIL